MLHNIVMTPPCNNVRTGMEVADVLVTSDDILFQAVTIRDSLSLSSSGIVALLERT